MKSNQILLLPVFIILMIIVGCQSNVSENTLENDVVNNNNVNANINQKQQVQQQNIQQRALNQYPNRVTNNDVNNRVVSYRDSIDQPPAPPEARNRIQIALLLDTSNSMDGLIDQAKSQLWKMVNELAKAKKDEEDVQIELSLFEYGNDGIPAEQGHVFKVNRLTIDLEWVSDKLFQLTTYGGEEYCGWAIKDATELLTWSDNNNDLKVIFIAGNEPFNQGPKDYKEFCRKANEKGIIINTIHCGGYEEGIDEFWKDGATLTKGQYMNIDQNEKVVHISTPYDEKVLEINEKLNGTYISYGSGGASRKEMQSANDVASAEYSTANTRTRAFYKSKSNYKNYSWDLVDATEKDYDEAMEKVDKKHLPEELKGKSDEEIKAYIEAKRKERIELQKELAAYEKQVNEYIVQKKKENAEEDASSGNTLDDVMIKAIREQAESKGFLFNN